jgi:hypothetical protein
MKKPISKQNLANATAFIKPASGVGFNLYQEKIMSILHTVSPEAATGEVAEIYAQIASAWGRVPTVIQLFSANPFLLRQQWEYYGSMMQHPTLSFALTACIRMLVSQAGSCSYCIDMNAGMLIQMAGWTPEQVAAPRADF